MIVPFLVNPLQVNCYMLVDEESREAGIVDPGMFYDRERDAIREYIGQERLHLTHVILTHGHFDHAMSCQWVLDTYGIAPTMHADDVPLLQNCTLQIKQFLHRDMNVTQPSEQHTVAHGDTISIGSLKLQVIHTPGHTPGGICLYNKEENYLLSGDTLFLGSVGRTDLMGGDFTALTTSIKQRLFILPANTAVLPGHGPATNIGYETAYNQFVK